MSTLKPDAKLSDVMRAHLSDAEAFQQLVAEVLGWRDWYTKEAKAWGSKR